MNNYLDFEQEWLNKHPDRKSTLNKMRKALDVKEVTWSMLTKVNLVKVADYFKDCVTGNSCRTYFAELNSFLHCYEDEGIIPCKHPEEVLKATKEPQQNVALTEGELKLIEDYYNNLLKVKGKKPEKDVLTLFLIEAITGARSCDVEDLSINNIKDNKLSYVSKKTHVLAVIPEHRRLQELLMRKPKKAYSNTTKNRTIKRIAEKVGITQPITLYYHGAMETKPKFEYLGTHSARRSFASILSEKGVPIAEIAQYMSHTNTSMTERYIKVDNQKASMAALSFFNG